MSILEICEKLAPVNKDYIREYKRSGGFSGTEINPQWRFKRMTEVFGPVGKYWGWEIDERWSEDFGAVKVCFAMVSVWYVDDEQRKNENGQVYRSTIGPYIGGSDAKRTPDEAYKMAITDAIGKCLSVIGLGADVYMGNLETKHDYATQEQIDTLAAMIAAHDVDPGKLLRTFGVATLAELSESEAEKAISMIEKKYGAK